MLKSIQTISALMAFAAVTSSGCVASSRAGIIQTYATKNICEAAKLPLGADGVKVTLVSAFRSDRRHFSGLQDWENCPEVTVLLYEGPDTVKDEVYQSFDRIFHQLPVPPGHWEIKACVNVYGTLRAVFPNRYRLDVLRYLRVREQQNKSGKTKDECS